MTFADLHHRDTPLVLPNAWDVPSALALAAAGFEAIATTSFGVAVSHGRPDGDRATRDANLALSQALRSVPGYLSVDIEDGYTDDPDQVADYAARLAADGINIEDSTAGTLIPPEAHAAKIAAIKRRCPALFVNARVDTYWFGQHATVEETVARALVYARAGADGIFVPGAAEPAVLRELTAAIPLPVNTLPVRGVAELGELGVRRVSTGSLPYRVAVHAATAAALAVRDGGQIPESVPYADLQARLVAHDETTSGPELQVIARYTVKAGKEDEVAALLPKLAEASRAEPGNLAFVPYHEQDDPREVVLLERYASRAAFARHRESPHFKELVLERIVPLLDRRVVETYEVSG